MLIQHLEQEPARRSFIEANRTGMERKSSEGIWHERQDYTSQEPMGGLRQSREHYSDGGSMREIFRVENAYGTISLGMNRKKETAFVVNRKKNKNGVTVSRNQREVDEQMSYRWRGHAGDRELNRFNPVSSAFVLRSEVKHEAESRTMGHMLMRETERFGELTGQHQVLSFMPERENDRFTSDEMLSMHEKMAGRMEIALRREMSRMSEERKNESEVKLRRVMDSILDDGESADEATDPVNDDDKDNDKLFYKKI
ncbi:MAG: hypothetical protein J5819_07950 [Eubacterium sp.]|nr:hypothetical protein [Eubacterium sp.]